MYGPVSMHIWGAQSGFSVLFKKKEVMTLGGVEPGGVGGRMGSEYD